MRKKNYISEVVTQYLQHGYAQETEEKVQRWLVDETCAAEKNRALEAWWDSLPASTSPQTHTSLAQVKARLGMDAAKMPARRRWLRVAAVLLPFFLLAGSYFLLKSGENAVNITVPYGESREIRLPDASTVFLNAGSSLKYDASFGKKERRVKLTGEACFSVTKDASRVFTVETEHLSVEVLGTVFNIKAYPSETKTVATLNSGKIRAKTDDGKAYILHPDEQLLHDSRLNSTSLAHVDAENYSNWKEGRLIFGDMTLGEILAVIERKFDVRFAAEDIDLDESFSVKFVHGENLAQIMKIMEALCGFDCRMEDKTVCLTKKRNGR